MAKTRPLPAGSATPEMRASPNGSGSEAGGVTGARLTAPNATVPPVKPVPSAAKAIACVVELPSSPIPSRSVNAAPSSAAKPPWRCASWARASAARPRSTGALIARVPNAASGVAAVATER
jgi:hypothetical protein